MHILLTVLKITGIFLLALLALLLAAVLLVLLVPVRYRVRAGYHGEPAGTVRVTWLFRALSLLVTYDGELDAEAKALGHTVFRLRGPGGEEEEEPEGAGTREEAEKPENSGEPGEDGKAEGTEGPKEAEKPVKGAGEPEGPEKPAKETGEPEGPEKPAEEAAPDEKAGTAPEKKVSRGTGPAEEDMEDKAERLCAALCETWNRFEKKRIRLARFLENPDTRYTAGLLWRQLKRIVLHVLPRRVRGAATLGFDDPATTGEVLAVCAVLQTVYGEEIEITPDFGGSALEGDLDLEGRVRPGVPALCAVRVLADRRFWSTLKRIKQFQANGGI